MDNKSSPPKQPESSLKKSGLHALLNSEDIMSYNQTYENAPGENPNNINPYDSNKQLPAVVSNNVTIEPNEVARRVAQLSIDSPNNKDHQVISPYQSGSSACETPKSNLSNTIRSNGSYTPYYKSSGPTSRDEMIGSSGKPNETALEKRQRRLIRNRIAAQDSRLKKKLYVTELEEKVKRLEGENFKLYHDIRTLNAKLGGAIAFNELDQENITANHHQPVLPSQQRNYNIPEHLLPSRPASTPPVISQKNNPHRDSNNFRQ